MKIFRLMNLLLILLGCSEEHEDDSPDLCPAKEELMKTTKTYAIITLLMIFTLIALPTNFAQGVFPEYVVRALHFVPKDFKHDPNVEDDFDKRLKDAQQFFADEMERHGFGRKTFKLETNRAGKVVFHRVKGRFVNSHYAANVFTIDSPEMLGFDTSKNIYIYIAGLTPQVGQPAGYGSSGQRAVVILPYKDKDTCQIAASQRNPMLHELGHAFGLGHDWRTGTLMSYGISVVTTQLSKCAAEWLDVHRYFNRNPTDIDTTPTTIEMLTPLAYPPNAIRLRFQITDADGLHQAQLIGPTDYLRGAAGGLLACRLLSGKRNTTVEFITTELVLGPESIVSFRVIDKHGNFTAKNFSIRENDVRVDRQNRIDINSDGVTNADDRIPARLRKVSGDNQHGLPNAWFPKPLVVEVLDAKGKPVVGVKVEFRVRISIDDRVSVYDGFEHNQFGLLSDPTPRTDANGQAKSYLMVGDREPWQHPVQPDLFKYTVTVSVPGIDQRVRFDTFDWSVKVLIPPETGYEMYWISRVGGLVSTRGEFTTHTVSRNAIDVVSDGFGRIFYLQDTEFHSNSQGFCAAIVRIDLSARRWRKVIIQPTSRSLGIAVHPRKGKLYWTNALGNIQTCNLDGSNIQNLITGLNSPKHITVDTVGSKLYWTDGRERIQRADLNGKNIQIFARSRGTLGHITIAENHLYWAEKIDKASGNIRRANIKTKRKYIRTVVRDVDAPIGVDIVDDKLYWTDTVGRIRRATRDGSQIEDIAIRLVAPGALAIHKKQAAPPSAAPIYIDTSPPPEATQLLPNYPNPFNPETWIPYQLSKPAEVTLHIYAVDGRLIRTLALGHQPAGMYQSKNHSAYWDGRNAQGEPVASGVYFYTLTAGDFTATRRMLIMK